ncbi:MAG: transcriptional regulator PpsR [Sphingomonas sp.]|uniref:transcriptional regulator PpsR n=1 Tax=Sphingomonas sp. TaxID=28214 RepID=UPI0035A88286|nr:transcriptional regulator PpsR [Sphingomonas sp.]
MNKHLAPPRPRPFSLPDQIPGALPANVAAALLGSVGDVSFVIDSAGIVLDVAIAETDLLKAGLADWVGKPWADSVTTDSKTKVCDMLAAAAAGEPGRWRQINHAGPEGDLPVRYMIVGLGRGGQVIAIGRDMRAAATMQQRLLQTQQSLERDYVRLRQAETRYRLLFDMAAEPVLIVDATTRRIREANPAAHRLFGSKEGALSDQLVSGLVDPTDREAFVAHLGAAEAADDIAPVALRLKNQAIDASFSARLFRQARTAVLLVRITAIDAPTEGHQHDGQLVDVIERMPDAFVLVDRNLGVMTANAAFVELTEMASMDRLRGLKLGDWLGRPGIDLDLIVGQLREHGAVRNVAAVFRGAAGNQEEVEVSAVAAPLGDSECYGFAIRNVGRRLPETPASNQQLPRSVEQLTELVGRMSLKDIVRESTDLIERLCIEAALAYTSDNRASAAEILGVSRQSLYSKLHRHGLGNLVSDNN